MNEKQYYFKQDVFNKISPFEINILKKHASIISQNSFVNDGYYIPKKLLQDFKILKTIETVCKTHPISKKFNKKEQYTPFPLFDYKKSKQTGDEYFHCPREIGVRLFGLPPQQDHVFINNKNVLPKLDMKIPLYNAANCKENYNIDQEYVVDKIVAHLKSQAEERGFGTGIFSASCGRGKSCMFSAIMARLGHRCLLVVPNVDNLMQMKKEIESFIEGINIGTMNTQNKSNWKNICEDNHLVITTMDSVLKYDLSRFDTVIVDEAHLSLAPKRSQMYLKFSQKYILLVTATPEKESQIGCYFQFFVNKVLFYEAREIAETLWKTVDVNVFTMNHDTLVEEFLNPRRPTPDTISWPKMRNQLMSFEYRTIKIANLIIESVKFHGDVVIGLSSRVLMLELLQQYIEEHSDIKCGLIVGERSDGTSVSSEEREIARTREVIFVQKSIGIQALNVKRANVLIPDLSGGSITQETNLIQACGRVLRHHETKNDPKLWIFNDCYLKKSRDVKTNDKKRKLDDWGGIFANSVRKCVRLLQQLDGGYRINYFDF